MTSLRNLQFLTPPPDADFVTIWWSSSLIGDEWNFVIIKWRTVFFFACGGLSSSVQPHHSFKKFSITAHLGRFTVLPKFFSPTAGFQHLPVQSFANEMPLHLLKAATHSSPVRALVCTVTFSFLLTGPCTADPLTRPCARLRALTPIDTPTDHHAKLNQR